MDIKVKTSTLSYIDQKTHVFYFLPKGPVTTFAAFSHGYTSHKDSILNWGIRLAEEGLAVAIFDLPGHLLGHYSEVQSMDEFEEHTPALFAQAIFSMEEYYEQKAQRLILGGHSLGALMALMALNLPSLASYKKIGVAVGLGVNEEGQTHLFQTPFYKSTLNIRAQLVSPAIHPEILFPRIDTLKRKLQLKGETVFFLAGEDDIVTGPDGPERMAKILKDQGNDIILEKPKRLPHHLPEMAAPHLKKWLKDQGYFQSK